MINNKCDYPICVSEQRTTLQGQVYFLHTHTGVSTWHDPRIPRGQTEAVRDEDLGPMPEGWEVCLTPRLEIALAIHFDMLSGHGYSLTLINF